MSKASHHEAPYCLDCGSERIAHEYSASMNGNPIKEKSILWEAATAIATYIADEMLEHRQIGARYELFMAAETLDGVFAMLKARDEADAKAEKPKAPKE